MTRDALDRLSFPVLIGDIGGTNARFALVEDADSPLYELPIVRTDDYDTIGAAIEDAVFKHSRQRPRSAMVALAGPITGDRVPLTNSDWVVEPKVTIKRCDLEEMVLLNDFEALSLSLPDLGAGDIDPIGDGRARDDGPRVVVGPGTGLGAGALIRGHEGWVPVPGEGGHVDLGPVSERDFEIWPNLERVLGRISGEALLSGPGLVRLYRGICKTDGVEATLDHPWDISDAGLSGGNPQAVEALTLFATYLGRLAGDLALIFMARGGVYVAGGVSIKIAAALKAGAFREAFVDKEPHRDVLETIVTAIIVKKDAALAGIAAFARRPGRFEVNLAGRRWRR